MAEGFEEFPIGTKVKWKALYSPYGYQETTYTGVVVEHEPTALVKALHSTVGGIPSYPLSVLVKKLTKIPEYTNAGGASASHYGGARARTYLKRKVKKSRKTRKNKSKSRKNLRRK